MILLEKKQERIHIRLRALFMGDDICVLIDGGDRPHVGALALAPYGVSHPLKQDFFKEVSANEMNIHNAENVKQLEMHTFSLPYHKEGALSERIAAYLRAHLQRTVICLCGIHIHNIRPEEIESVLTVTHDLAEELVQKISS